MIITNESMDTKKPNPKTVNPYDSKAYTRSNGYSVASRPNPRSVNPYSSKDVGRINKLKH
jgi:hypothetical protein